MKSKLSFSLIFCLIAALSFISCSDSVAGVTHESNYVGHIVDIQNQKVYPGRINVDNDIITSIDPLESVDENAPYFLPGMTDSHIHIESTMLTPANFSKIAVAFMALPVIPELKLTDKGLVDVIQFDFTTIEAE